MKIVCKALVALTLLAVCSLVAWNTYRMDTALIQIDGVTMQVMDAPSATVIVLNLQEVVSIQAHRLVRIEKQLDVSVAYVTQAREHVQLLEAALEVATTQLRDLIDDNSKLEAELDSASSEMKLLETKLQQTRDELIETQQKLKDAQQKLAGVI